MTAAGYLGHEALDFLVARLWWPVPLVRWRAARALRDLMEAPATRGEATRELLSRLAAARCESEVCTMLTVFLMARSEARPASSVLTTTLRHPSVLAGVLLRHLGGTGDLEWKQAHSGPAPAEFEPEAYFEEYRTTHVPPVLSTNLTWLERRLRQPFMRQWGFEWQRLQDATGVPRTEYPYYFDSFSEFRSGIVGQYIQGQGELYRSAYLRTLALAVEHGRLPVRLAETFAMDVVPAVPGLFEIDPGSRPAWLGDIPERCAATPDDLARFVRELIDVSRGLDMRPVSLDIPIDSAIAQFGALQVSAFLATDEFTTEGVLEDRIELPDFEAAFRIAGERPETPLPGDFNDGPGAAAPVCPSMLPQPYGYWQGHYFATGMPVPASYVLPSPTDLRCTRDVLELVHSGRTIAKTAFWHDRWSPNYPREGHTRCGVCAMLDPSMLDATMKRLGCKLVWKAHIRLWQRERDYGDYTLLEKTAVMFD
jgi:hypothetical protein